CLGFARADGGDRVVPVASVDDQPELRIGAGTVARKKTSVKAPRVISIATKEANLRRKIRKHLRGIGFAGSRDGVLQFEGSGKDVIRALHRSHRNDRIASNQEFIAATTPDLACHFADGSE